MYTAKNSEKKICPFLENEFFFLKMSYRRLGKIVKLMPVF